LQLCSIDSNIFLFLLPLFTFTLILCLFLLFSEIISIKQAIEYERKSHVVHHFRPSMFIRFSLYKHYNKVYWLPACLVEWLRKKIVKIANDDQTMMQFKVSNKSERISRAICNYQHQRSICREFISTNMHSVCL